MRFARFFVVPVALAAACALVSPASAADGGVVTDVIGSIALVDNPSLDSQLSGYCTYGRTSAGVETVGGGVTFTVAAEATATGLYKGVEIVATSVVCELVKPDTTITAGPDWLPGAASASVASGSTWNASVSTLCLQVFAILRHVPIGESDNLISTARTCH